MNEAEIKDKLAFGDLGEDDARALQLANSKMFDVHTRPEHPEVDDFVQPIYEQFIHGRKG